MGLYYVTPPNEERMRCLNNKAEITASGVALLVMTKEGGMGCFVLVIFGLVPKIYKRMGGFSGFE